MFELWRHVRPAVWPPMSRASWQESQAGNLDVCAVCRAAGRRPDAGRFTPAQLAAVKVAHKSRIAYVARDAPVQVWAAGSCMAQSSRMLGLLGDPTPRLLQASIPLQPFV